MFAKHLLTAGAVIGLLMTGAVTGAALAQAPAAEKPMKKSMPMHKSSMHKGGMAKEGHKMDNIADKLNQCQTMPQAQRGGCMDSATKM